MIACLIGTIKKIKSTSITIEDRVTREQFDCFPKTDDYLNLKEGEQGVFIGKLIGGSFEIERIEIRKFLDPLYEEELFDASGKFTLVPVIDNPFTDCYLKYMEGLNETKPSEAEAPVP